MKERKNMMLQFERIVIKFVNNKLTVRDIPNFRNDLREIVCFWEIIIIVNLTKFNLVFERRTQFVTKINQI